MGNNIRNNIEGVREITILSIGFGVILALVAIFVPFLFNKLTYFDTFGFAALVAIIFACVIDYNKCNKPDYTKWERAINTYKIIILFMGAIVAAILYCVDLLSLEYEWIKDTNHINVLITTILAIFALEEGAKSYFK